MYDNLKGKRGVEKIIRIKTHLIHLLGNSSVNL